MCVRVNDTWLVVPSPLSFSQPATPQIKDFCWLSNCMKCFPAR